MHAIRLLLYLLEDRELDTYAFVKPVAGTPSRLNLASWSHATDLKLRLARPYLSQAGRTRAPDKTHSDHSDKLWPLAHIYHREVGVGSFNSSNRLSPLSV
jgi:hypothetical protein